MRRRQPVLTFAHNQARDDFVEIAEGFGGVYETGDNYVVEAVGEMGSLAGSLWAQCRHGRPVGISR